MLTGNEFFVTLKLVSGEQLMAVLEAEDEQHIQLDFPIVLHGRIDVNRGKEVMMAAPFSQFSDSTSFVLEKSHVIFIKKMHPAFVENYLEFVKAYDVVALNKREDKEEMSFEDIREQLEELGIFDESEEERVFVQGNDTKH